MHTLCSMQTYSSIRLSRTYDDISSLSTKLCVTGTFTKMFSKISFQGLETRGASGQKAAASVVMESGSVDITQMELEDFTSQRLQDAEDIGEDKQNTSPESSPVKITGKRNLFY